MSIEEFKIQNWEKVCDLYKVIYKQDFRSVFQKKIQTTKLCGIDPIGFIASENDLTIGVYLIFPYFTIHEDKRILIAQSGDTMTHPDFQKKGIFQQLFEKTAEKAKSLGVRYIYGFPNKNSYHGLKKFGWSVDSEMQTISLNNPISLLNKIFRKIYEEKFEETLKNKLKKYKVNYLPEDLKKYNNLSSVKLTEDFFMYKQIYGAFLIKFNDVYLWVNLNSYSVTIGDIYFEETLRYQNLLDLSRFFNKLGFEQTNITIDKTHNDLYFKTYENCKSQYYIMHFNFDFPSLRELKYSGIDSDTF